MTSENQRLFKEFPAVSREEWEKKILEDLKGAPYGKLITKTIEGIDIKPFYHPDDTRGFSHLHSLPGEFPHQRSDRENGNDWEIREEITVSNPRTANEKALSALNRGAGSLSFEITDPHNFSYTDFSGLLKEIMIDCISVHFRVKHADSRWIEFFRRLSSERNFNPAKINASVDNDFISLLSTGEYAVSDTGIFFDSLAGQIRESQKDFPGLRLINIHADVFHNAGGSAVQELAFGMSVLADYLDALTSRGLTIDQLGPQTMLHFATGPSYFMEIAKYRAARILYSNIIRAYNPHSPETEKAQIHAGISEWNQTAYDPYVNMLRATTEGMSAVLGGVDSLSLTPFDKAFREPTAFSERIARNTQIILREEAYLDKIVDPGAGSWFIETLTIQLAEKAWELFILTEEKGGYMEAFRKGFVLESVQETARARDLNIALRKEILLGTNQYPDPAETLDPETTKYLRAGFSSKNDSADGFLKKYRGAEAFEQLRMKTENSGKQPLVFLLGFGNPVWSKARAGFSSGFFACAGYKIADRQGFSGPEEGIREAQKAGADIIVLCSSDEEYLKAARAAADHLKEDDILVIAGYPKESIEELKELGIRHFIHMKSNLLEELKKFNSLLGIN